MEEQNEETVKPDEPVVDEGAPAGPPVMLMPHELGGIKLVARGADGSVAISRLELPEAAILLTHLNALITMMYQTHYAQAAMAAQQMEDRKQVFIPRR